MEASSPAAVIDTDGVAAPIAGDGSVGARYKGGMTMTWGSNASYDKVTCPWCGDQMIDDADTWPTSHMKYCFKRPSALWRWWKRNFG